MKKIINVYIYKGEKYYIAECIDIPVVTQALSLDELVLNIKEAISLHLEDEDLTQYDLNKDSTILANLEIDTAIYV